MRELGTAARHLPFQRITKAVGLYGQKKQVCLTGKVFRSRFSRLFRGREMHIAIGDINRRARGRAVAAQSLPFN